MIDNETIRKASEMGIIDVIDAVNTVESNTTYVWIIFSAGFETANFISTGLFKIVFANCCILAGIVAENMMGPKTVWVPKVKN